MTALPDLRPGWAIRLLPLDFEADADPELQVDPGANTFLWRFYASDVTRVAGAELECIARWKPDTPHPSQLPVGCAIHRVSAPIGGGWDDAFFLVHELRIEDYIERIEERKGKLADRLREEAP